MLAPNIHRTHFMIRIGQVWKDGNDILFITEVKPSDDRVLVKGTAILANVRTAYTCWAVPNDIGFGALVFDPQIDDSSLDTH
jgi:hypothetical protein